jgi:hypothetical protein
VGEGGREDLESKMGSTKVKGEGNRGERRQSNRGVNMIKVFYMHVWECHNEPPYFVQSIYAIKK